ncbi:MAG TPA: condensation domain-containing protein [Candidatus Elarobacter sp.]|nr:condensation domain-containing protein [Candidatus Elarobacter sp.]
MIGFPVAGRSAPGSECLVAYCSHLLPLRSSFGYLAFVEYLARVRARLLEAYEHQDHPFAKLIETLNPVRAPSRPPIVNATFNMERSIGLQPLHKLTAELLPPPVSSTEHDLHLNVTEIHGKLLIDFVYNTGFDAITARRILGHYRTLPLAGGT